MLVAQSSRLLRPLGKVFGAIGHLGTAGLRCANILFILPFSLARLIAHYQTLRRAQVVVVMSHPSGFGHTITGPDVTRRLFPDRRPVFVVLSQNVIHNWKVACIWPDIGVIFLRCKLSFSIPNAAWPTKFFRAVIHNFIRWVTGGHALILYLSDLYERIPIPDTLVSSLDHLKLNYRWPIAYFNLQLKVAAPSVMLPQRWREEVGDVLNRVLPPSKNVIPTLLCGMYLRQKGVNSEDITEWRRNGSPFENYMPAIRLLNRAGYRVLLTGDVGLSPSLYTEFDGMLVDAQILQIDKMLFEIYAATEVDIFIGESGGGIWLPGINGIPRLLLNAFPFSTGMPGSWVYYKTATDLSGQLVHYTKLFTEHSYDYELKGMTLHNNNAEEIYNAVCCFIDDVVRSRDGDPYAHVVSGLPDHTWAKQAKTRLSPAWLRLYEEES